MAFAHLKNVTLQYELTGREDAPVLVLSHSLGASLDIWLRQEQLTSAFRILRYDARGHGLSTALAGEYTLAHLSEDVTALLDLLRIEKAHFCGVSLGGMTGLWLAIHAPHRLHSLIAVDTAARIGTPQSWDTRIAQVRNDGLVAIVEGTLERWYTEVFRVAQPDQIDATRRIFLATTVEGYSGCCAAIRDADLTAAVGSIDLPTLVMTGVADVVTPVRDGLFLKREIAGARFVELNGAHLAHVEDVTAFERNVLDFIRHIA